MPYFLMEYNKKIKWHRGNKDIAQNPNVFLDEDLIFGKVKRKHVKTVKMDTKRGKVPWINKKNCIGAINIKLLNKLRKEQCRNVDVMYIFAMNKELCPVVLAGKDDIYLLAPRMVDDYDWEEILGEKSIVVEK